jgi:hypothetical protein
MQDDIVIARTTAARAGIALFQPPPYTACKIPFQMEERPSSRSAPCNQVLLVPQLLITHPAFLFSRLAPHLYLPHIQSLIRMPLTNHLIPTIAFLPGVVAASNPQLHWVHFVPHGSFLNQSDRTEMAGEMQTLGHAHSSSFRSLALTALRLASHHLPCFSWLIVGTMTPLACRDAPVPAAAPALSSHHAAHRVRRC